MWYNEKHQAEIETVTDALLRRCKDGDIEGAKGLRDELERLIRLEIQWIVAEVQRGNIRKRK